MAGLTKNLAFSEGITVTNPTFNFLETTSFQTFANDAAYVTAKGAAVEEGDAYANTTDNHIHFYDGTSWQVVEDALNNFIATVAPINTNDDSEGYVVGSTWIDVTGDEAYIAVDVTTSSAVWQQISPGATPNLSTTSKIANYTLLASDDLVIGDATSDSFTFTLPAAASNDGKVYKIKRIDASAETDIDTFVDGDVTTGTDNINIASHPFVDLQKLQLTTDGTLPAGLALATDYYVIFIDSDNIKLAASRVDAVADTAVDITAAAGGGTHTITSEVTEIIIDANASETIDGALTKKLFTQYEQWEIASDGTNWQVIGHKTINDWSSISTIVIDATTTAPTKGAIVRDRVMWRRVGPNMEAHYDFEQSGAGSGGTGTYLYAIPGGFSANTGTGAGQIDVDTSTTTVDVGTNLIGHSSHSTTGTVDSGFVKLFNSTQFYIFANDAGLVSSGVFSFGNQQSFSIKISVPIAGWEA